MTMLLLLVAKILLLTNDCIVTVFFRLVRPRLVAGALLVACLVPEAEGGQDIRIFKGDATHAYRDPAAVCHNGRFHLFFTLVETEADGSVFSYLATSESTDLVSWTPPMKLTSRDNSKDYSSPGNVVRDGDEWVLCLQTYPRPDNRNDGKVRYANEAARLFAMRSHNLRDWSAPELLKVKGPAVPEKEMGRMIDPYLLKHPDGGWMCFYKQNGVSFSRSPDLKTWTPVGRAEAGENVCVVQENGRYLMVHSPQNGLGLKSSADLLHWQDLPGQITLGQADWPWARGRLTAGFLLDARQVEGVGKWLLFFHASGPRKEHEGDFDRNASLALVRADSVESFFDR